MNKKTWIVIILAVIVVLLFIGLRSYTDNEVIQEDLIQDVTVEVEKETGETSFRTLPANESEE